MSFFFSEPKKQSASNKPSKETLHALGCKACPLWDLPNNNRDIPPSGTDKPYIYFLAEAPGRTEDEKGEPLVGDSGFLLKTTLAKGYSKLVGNEYIPRSEADEFCKSVYRFNNVVRTRPPKNRTPEYTEIECFPGNTKVQSLGKINKIYRRWYEGELITIKTSSGNVLTGTPNHPIITPSGTVALGNLSKGDNVINARASDNTTSGFPDINSAPSSIEEVFNTLSMSFNVDRVSGKTRDFHGDGKNSYVDIISTNSFLGNGVKSPIPQQTSSFQIGGNVNRVSHILEGKASIIEVDKVVSVTRNINFSGHVYNLETESSHYLAHNVLVHNCCRPSVIADIENIKPKLIVGLGHVPLTWVTGNNRLKISEWSGRLFPVKIGEHKCWFMSASHPASILRSDKFKIRGKINRTGNREVMLEIERAFRFNLQKAQEICQDLPEPIVYSKDEAFDNVEIIFSKNKDDDLDRIEKLIKESLEWEDCAVDIETNCLRPYYKNAKILSISIGKFDNTFVFGVDHPQAGWSVSQRKRLQDIISYWLSKKSVKIAQNLSFELEWFCYFFGWDKARASEWQDTMAQAYILDSRKGALDMDSLCMQNMGMEIKDISNINVKTLEKQPILEVLKYNSIDTKYTSKLFMIQKEKIRIQKLEKVYKDQMRRIPTLVLTQLQGLPVSQERVEKHKDRLDRNIKSLTTKIRSLDHVQKYENEYGKFNPSSPKQVGTLLFKVIGENSVYQGEDRNYATGEDKLKEIDIPFTKYILEYRSLIKARSTYVESLDINGEEPVVFPDGKLHTSYMANFTVTRRLSSRDPNVQNWPKREDEKSELRDQIVAPPNHLMVSIDYGAIEVRVVAMASKDPFLVEVLNEGQDVHMEWTRKLAEAYPKIIGGEKYLEDSSVMKKFRTDVKNQWTFPLFYGSWYGSVARNTGIPESIIKPLVEEFWDRYAGVKRWQETTTSFYEDNGYLESLTGFRFRCPMEYTEIINYIIQGTASDIVIDAMNRLSEMAQDTGKWQLQPVLQIHDDITFFLPEKTADKDLNIILHEMLNVPFSFVNVPMLAEPAWGKDWHKLEPLGDFTTGDI